MKAQEFIKRLLKTATEVRTYYLMGGFGQRLKTVGGDWYDVNYQYNKDHAAEIDAHKDTDPLTFGFDCVCLVKGILWGFVGDPEKAFGGAVYESNGVKDSSISKIAKQCKGLSKDFANIQPGELVFLEGYGHVGVYVGDGLVVESTPAWKNGVQLTSCANLGTVKGYPSRRWDEHGKCAWIEYPTEAKTWEEKYNELQKAYNELEQEAGFAARELAALRDQNDQLIAEKAGLSAFADSMQLEKTKAQQEAADAAQLAQKAAQEAEKAKQRAATAEARVSKYRALRGDMNGDGKVNLSDVMYLLNHIQRPSKYPLADIEGGEET